MWPWQIWLQVHGTYMDSVVKGELTMIRPTTAAAAGIHRNQGTCRNICACVHWWRILTIILYVLYLATVSLPLRFFSCLFQGSTKYANKGVSCHFMLDMDVGFFSPFSFQFLVLKMKASSSYACTCKMTTMEQQLVVEDGWITDTYILMKYKMRLNYRFFQPKKKKTRKQKNKGSKMLY